ncbi:pantoate--beta-alanine ligase [Desulfovibrionales bacterium]
MYPETSPAAMQHSALAWRAQGRIVGLVPTMGYWHEGHMSLVRWAREHCDILVASIFVNPTQFGPQEDLASYPHDLDRDAAIAQDLGVDVLFCPSKDQIYGPDHDTWITVPSVAAHLCGRSRPTHFQGVATIVCKLFQLTQPSIAVFGEKDWQQLALIRAMTRDLNLPVHIEGRPIVREPDGLAMSSRNVYLTPEERAVAPHIHKGLKLLAEAAYQGLAPAELIERTTAYYAHHIPTGQLDYLELVDPVRVQPVTTCAGDVVAAVALRLGKARLIDNILISCGN